MKQRLVAEDIKRTREHPSGQPDPTLCLINVFLNWGKRSQVHDVMGLPYPDIVNLF